MIALLVLAPEGRMSLPRLSILDTFLLFPQYLHKISYAGMGEIRVELRQLDVPSAAESYVNLPDIRSVYRELQTFQKAAFRQLVAKGLISRDEYTNGSAQLNGPAIPARLFTDLNSFCSENRDLLEFLVHRIGALQLDGANGIYRRANLELGGRFR
ncbi:MAG: hypothetical protein ACJAZW_002163 [Maritalea sp.]